ncbi:methyltransferase domain-containing protein [Desulfopila sp. IMCC35008]|uniref:class I SAM-dependent methyltransferase n=1 Tax=Desulfopila sp. IMCC35008 TaxID=2653858 RepID=UPI0013D070CA
MPPVRIRYQTIEIEDIDIHVRTLWDSQQYSDPDGIASRLGISSATWPLFGVVWGSSEVLAHLMVNHKIEGIRILEVGCGIGLASLVLNHRLADITSTDYHPEVQSFLQENTQLNNGPDIPFIRTAWADTNTSLGTFDLIRGSDLLYERDHAADLSHFIGQHSKTNCEVIIVDPGRGQSASFSKNMNKFGYTISKTQVCSDILRKGVSGKILHYHR